MGPRRIGTLVERIAAVMSMSSGSRRYRRSLACFGKMPDRVRHILDEAVGFQWRSRGDDLRRRFRLPGSPGRNEVRSTATHGRVREAHRVARHWNESARRRALSAAVIGAFIARGLPALAVHQISTEEDI